MGRDARFPRLVAETLSGQPLVLPDSLENGVALVVLVFRRHAQPIVDSWLHPVARRYDVGPRFSWYEIPMLAGGWRIASGFIDSGMRSGIAPAHHAHVATCYGDSTRIRERLGIDDLSSAYGYLIDEQGDILWSDSGWAQQRKLDSLFRTLDESLRLATGHVE